LASCECSRLAACGRHCRETGLPPHSLGEGPSLARDGEAVPRACMQLVMLDIPRTAYAAISFSVFKGRCMELPTWVGLPGAQSRSRLKMRAEAFADLKVLEWPLG